MYFIYDENFTKFTRFCYWSYFFFIYYLFHIEVKIFAGEKWQLGEENFPRQKILSDKVFPDRVIVSPKSVVTPSKIRTVINFYAKALKRFPESVFAYILDLAFIGQITFSRNFENDWNKNVNLKITLIGDNLFLRMFCNKIKVFRKTLCLWLGNRSVAKSYFCNDIFRTISNQ